MSAVYSTCDMSILAFTSQEGSLTGIKRFTSQKISLWYVPPSFLICSSVKPQPLNVQVILFSLRRSISVFARRFSFSWSIINSVRFIVSFRLFGQVLSITVASFPLPLIMYSWYCSAPLSVQFTFRVFTPSSIAKPHSFALLPDALSMYSPPS